MPPLKKLQQSLTEEFPPADFAEQGDFTIPAVNLEMVRIEPGSFQMGADDGTGHERPAHTVTISRPFWMGKHEVTQCLFRDFINATSHKTQAEMQGWAWVRDGKNWKKKHGATWANTFSGENRPVVCVSWEDSVAFCRWLTDHDCSGGRLPTGYEYRLPTEAEWEYAARGGVNSRGFTYAGSNNVGDVAWYYENSGSKTHPVGGKVANELGLHDMSGNVWEWCYDWYDASFYDKGGGADPVNSRQAAGRVRRGGCWFGTAMHCRSANRYRNMPGDAHCILGFRVALAPAVQ